MRCLVPLGTDPVSYPAVTEMIWSVKSYCPWVDVPARCSCVMSWKLVFGGIPTDSSYAVKVVLPPQYTTVTGSDWIGS